MSGYLSIFSRRHTRSTILQLEWMFSVQAKLRKNPFSISSYIPSALAAVQLQYLPMAPIRVKNHERPIVSINGCRIAAKAGGKRGTCDIIRCGGGARLVGDISTKSALNICSVTVHFTYR